MITNFFSRAALAKVASLHSLQKPSELSIGAAWAAVVNDKARLSARMHMDAKTVSWSRSNGSATRGTPSATAIMMAAVISVPRAPRSRLTGFSGRTSR